MAVRARETTDAAAASSFGCVLPAVEEKRRLRVSGRPGYGAEGVGAGGRRRRVAPGKIPVGDWDR